MCRRVGSQIVRCTSPVVAQVLCMVSEGSYLGGIVPVWPRTRLTHDRLSHLLCYTIKLGDWTSLLGSCKACVQSRCTSARRWRRCGRTASGMGARSGRPCSSSSWPWPTRPPPPSSSPSPSSTSSSPGPPLPARPCPAHSAFALHSAFKAITAQTLKISSASVAWHLTCSAEALLPQQQCAAPCCQGAALLLQDLLEVQHSVCLRALL